MPNITPEGESRLATLNYLIDELRSTYPDGIDLNTLANKTGIPRTNLHKWSSWQVNPRVATYRAAVEALEDLLEERQGLPQGTVQNAHAELQKALEPIFTSKSKPDTPIFTLTRKEVRLLITALISFSLGSFATVFFLML